MFLKKILFAFSLLFLHHLAFGQIEISPIASKILKTLKIPESTIKVAFYSEKQMPNAPENSIYILPKFSEIGKENFDDNYFDLDANIIIANNTTGEILAKYQKPNAYTSDAIMLQNIAIDTGLYTLNEKTRAFGIRVNYVGMSRANPYDSTVFSLFMIKNNKIISVLNDFELNKSTGEWDTNCTGEFHDSTGTIAVNKEKTNDFGNITIKYNITNTKNFVKNNDCEFKETKSVKTKILAFNGKEYK